jgi:hypothetical protein
MRRHLCFFQGFLQGINMMLFLIYFEKRCCLLKKAWNTHSNKEIKNDSQNKTKLSFILQLQQQK